MGDKTNTSDDLVWNSRSELEHLMSLLTEGRRDSMPGARPIF